MDYALRLLRKALPRGQEVAARTAYHDQDRRAHALAFFTSTSLASTHIFDFYIIFCALVAFLKADSPCQSPAPIYNLPRGRIPPRHLHDSFLDLILYMGCNS